MGTLEVHVEWKEKESQNWESQELRERILFRINFIIEYIYCPKEYV